MPTFVSAGTIAQGTGSLTPGLPAGHQASDILVLFVQSANQLVTAPAGYTQLGPQTCEGVAAAAGSTRLAVFWKRDNGAESAPTITAPGNRGMAVIIAVRGCWGTGDPFFYQSNSFKTTASTTLTALGGTDSTDNSLIVVAAAHAISSAAGQLSNPVNTDLQAVTLRVNASSTDGVGGGFAIITAQDAVAGGFGNTTGTWGSSTNDVSCAITFIPADAKNVVVEPRTCEIQTFFGTPNVLFTDTWVKPSGAKIIEILACGSGGGGGNGRTSSQASGGGGGGGGGFYRKIFRAEDLPATLSVNAGAGGNGGANLAAGGSAGGGGAATIVSIPSGIQLVTANGGFGGNGAASNSGGFGGSGGGIGSPPAAASPATQGIGNQGAGGGSTNTVTSGGQGDGGGGGGGSAGSTTSGAGGGSQCGAGGGSSGATTAATSVAGGTGGGAVGSSSPGTVGTTSAVLPYGGGGGCGGNTATGQGSAGGFPGGGGGGGGSQTGSTGGGRGADGCVVIITWF